MIGIVDYGVGNIRAFQNVFKQINKDSKIVSKCEDLSGVDKLVLPGVGAFDYAMMMLNKSGLRDSLDRFVLREKHPVLGVCVGMQILAKSSDEGSAEGLGWIDAVVEKIPKSKTLSGHPLPHMGWNNIVISQESALLNGFDEKDRFYFLHSYFFRCEDKYVVAKTEYTNSFASVVSKNNVYGIQCHPEKSHNSGVKFLRNFGDISCYNQE